MDRETLTRMFNDIFTICTVLSEEDLAQYAEFEVTGQKPDEQLPAVRAHLDECPDCAGRHAELLALLQAEAEGKVPPLPHSHSFDLRFLHASKPASVERTPDPHPLGRLRQAKDIFEATLLPPLRLRQVSLRDAFPVRGPTGPRLKRFRAQEAGIDLHISVLESHKRGVRTLMGRLVPHEETIQPAPGLEIWLMRGEQAWTALTEAGGVFTFEKVEPGVYSIGLEWNEQAVVVREVEVT
jgi:hypothetical protein